MLKINSCSPMGRAYSALGNNAFFEPHLHPQFIVIICNVCIFPKILNESKHKSFPQHCCVVTFAWLKCKLVGPILYVLFYTWQTIGCTSIADIVLPTKNIIPQIKKDMGHGIKKTTRDWESRFTGSDSEKRNGIVPQRVLYCCYSLNYYV